jgi:hypothetical protein
MVGQGILHECLLDPGVQQILSIVRTPSGQQHPKLRELRTPRDGSVESWTIRQY